ncbi:T9SS type A sorting domain-containing protein [Flavobacterium sp. J372]|uniref:T9SS type A sorting domain-containing protein n=1 Tax=Flavobacterium sp. J372 TaxID=2898436 RepID=UPI0021509E49|nr:T9SS type A sorting domain-containing protein [Flavobacterium sp. J372]MCR5861009.1 T9SS type A sorting domain-containing protein [Flavobacterium sp. J372]
MSPYSKLAFVLGSIFCTVTAFSQDILWEKSYGGKHADFLFDVQPTADYGFLLAGSSLSNKTGNKTEPNNGNLDYWLWKMNEGGDLDWQKNYGGSGIDMLYSVKNTRDGGFILGGSSNSPEGFDKKDPCLGLEDFWIIKLNAKGGEEWQKTIGGAGSDVLKTIIQTRDGGYIIGGSSSSGVSEKILNGGVDPYGKSEKNRGALDFWIVKLDAQGKIKWQKTFGGRYADVLQSLEQTQDNGYIIGGTSNSPASQDKTSDSYGASDFWVIKLDAEGNMQWQNIFGGEGDDRLSVITQTKDKGYIIGGSSASSATGNKKKPSKNGTDFWILKLDEAGEITWQETYDNGATDLLVSLIENNDGSYLVGGYSKTETTGTTKTDKKEINDYLAFRINEKGEEIWKATAGSNGEDVLQKVVETRDRGYIMAGTAKGKASRDREGNRGSNDFWVVKLRDTHKTDAAQEKQMLEAIPNPAQQYTNVIVGYEFTTGTATVYDLGGRQLQQTQVTGRTIPIDLSPYPEGMYIIEVATNSGTHSVKVLKRKN